MIPPVNGLSESEALPANPPEPVCGAPTHSGTPCQLRPLAGPAGRCHQHANLPTTPAHQEAARHNALKHGHFAKGLIDEGEQERYEQHLEELEDVAAVKRAYTAFNMVRAERVARWEAKNGPSAVANAALATLGRALENLEPTPAQEARGLDEEELDRVVATVSRDPEVFLKRLPPEVQKEIRAVLEKAGVTHGPA